MSGGYIFPGLALRSTDVLDPRVFNDAILPAAERYSGNLNAHNFDGVPMKSALLVGDGAYYDHAYVSVLSDPGNGTWGTANPASPQSGSADMWTLPNDMTWYTVGSMTRTITTGTSILWVLAWLQYTWHVWTGGAGIVPHPGINATPFPGDYPGSDRQPANVLFAIRVDGCIVPGVSTGQNRHTIRNRQAIRHAQDFTPSGYYPGPRQPTGAEGHALGAHHRPVRLSTRVPVQPGSHTVEVMARRVPSTEKAGFASNDYIGVYSRRLFALDMKQMPPASLAAAFATATAFESEDPFSAAAVDTAAYQGIRAAYNAVDEGALARGALMNEHLPSAVLDVAQATITVEQTTNDLYMGFGTGLSIVPAAARTGDDGWWLLDDGGVDLRTDQTHAAAFDVSSQRSLLLVLANVEVRSVRPNFADAKSNFESYRDLGVFALGYRFLADAAGTVRIVGETEGSFNSCNPNLATDGGGTDRNENRDIWCDIPLMWVLDYTDAPVGSNIDWFGVYGSSPRDNTGPDGRVDVTYRNGAILVLQLRP